MTSSDLNAIEVNEESLLMPVYGDRDVGVSRSERHGEPLAEEVNDVVLADVSDEVISAGGRDRERDSGGT